MLNYCKHLLILALIASSPSVFAASTGMLINDDSVKAYYLGDANNTLIRNSRQQYSLIYSNETELRSMLLMADTELLDFQRPLGKGNTLTPKIATFLADFRNQYLLGLGGGAIFRRPPNEIRKYELMGELLVGPYASNQSDANTAGSATTVKWSWSFTLQASYPIADDSKLNFGVRVIQMRAGQQYNESFETGPYIGLSSHF